MLNHLKWIPSVKLKENNNVHGIIDFVLNY